MMDHRWVRHGVLMLLAAASALLLGRGIVQAPNFTRVGSLFETFWPFLTGVALLGLFAGVVLNPGMMSSGAGAAPVWVKCLSLGLAPAIGALIFWLASSTGFTLAVLVSGACLLIFAALLFLLGRTPLHGFYITLLLIPLLNLFSSELPQTLFNHLSLGPILVAPTIVLIAVCAVAVSLSGPVGWRYVRREPFLFTTVGLYAALGVISIFRSPDRWTAVNQWLLDGFYPLLGLFIVLQAVHDTRTWRQCLDGLMGCSAELAVFGWYFFVRPSSGAGAVDVRQFYGANLSVNLPSANLAQLLVLFMPLACVAAVRSSGIRQILYAVASVLFLGSIVLSYSRSALLGMMVSVVLLLKERRLRFWIFGLAAVTLVFALARPSLFKAYALTRLSDMHSSTLMSDNDLSWRIEAWQGSFKLIKDHPWGVGIGQWNRYATAYTLPRLTKLAEGNELMFITSPHNLFLNFAVETGWLGLFCLCSLFGSLMWILSRSLARGDWDALRFGSIAGLAAFLVSGFFAANFFAYRLNIVSGLLFWSFVGLAASLPVLAARPAAASFKKERPA